jgi:hypothetical protein
MRKRTMPRPLLPMFPADVTEINDLVSFAKREGTVYYFNGPMPVFSHAESDRASFGFGIRISFGFRFSAFGFTLAGLR